VLGHWPLLLALASGPRPLLQPQPRSRWDPRARAGHWLLLLALAWGHGRCCSRRRWLLALVLVFGAWPLLLALAVATGRCYRLAFWCWSKALVLVSAP